jgi:hypothetical protein
MRQRQAKAAALRPDGRAESRCPIAHGMRERERGEPQPKLGATQVGLTRVAWRA